MIAGPSEILVICDGKTTPTGLPWIYSHSEHDELAQRSAFPEADLSSGSGKYCPPVGSDAAQVGNTGFAGHTGCALIQVRDLDEACAIANHIAPEILSYR